jgi:hypothetical protein
MGSVPPRRAMVSSCVTATAAGVDVCRWFERTGLCPCEAGFASSVNFAAVGTQWTCDRAANRRVPWTPLFGGDSSRVCSGSSTSGAPLWFQHTLAAPQRVLLVAICKNSDLDNEDFEISSGDLLVRATVGFDKRTSCPSTTTTLPTTAPTIGTSASTSSLAINSTTVDHLTSLASVLAPSSEPVVESTDVALIAGIVGGAVALVVVAVWRLPSPCGAVARVRRGTSCPWW